MPAGACRETAGRSSPTYASHPLLSQAGSHLQRYAAALPAVEINSSFYRPHQPKTYARWRDTTPAGFRFSVKIPRTITHFKKLIGVGDLLDDFLGEVTHLGEKLGCLLLQLPPTLAFDAAVAGSFFHVARGKTPVKLMCEPRHPSWFSSEANALLAAHNVSRVIADPPPVPIALQAPPPVSDAVYLRLHGSPEIYRSTYSAAYLDSLGQWINLQREAGLSVWCVFDNTANGAALGNALYLLSCIR